MADEAKPDQEDAIKELLEVQRELLLGQKKIESTLNVISWFIVMLLVMAALGSFILIP